MGTPLEYIVCVGRPDKDARELTWFLIDRGADQDAAFAEARKYDHPSFIEWVKGGRHKEVVRCWSNTRKRRDTSACDVSNNCRVFLAMT